MGHKDQYSSNQYHFIGVVPGIFTTRLMCWPFNHLHIMVNLVTKLNYAGKFNSIWAKRE